jgi:hypothetical protein
LHSSNYLETLDFIREGLIGAGLGFVAGWRLPGWPPLTEPFGTDTFMAYAAIVFVVTCFGAWVGGLTGMARRTKKLLTSMTILRLANT